MMSPNDVKKLKVYKSEILGINRTMEDDWLPQRVKYYYKSTEGYVTSENAKNTIIRQREKFEACLIRYKGPTFIPTLFKNHASHFMFCRELERSQLAIRSPMKPPMQPLIMSTFADQVYNNIQCNFRKTPKCSVFLKHDKKSKVVHLGEKIFGEEACDELLMRKEPHFYSENNEEILKSKFVERDMNIWNKLPEVCSNCYQFLVEFCMIMPEVQVSTVMVTCVECGQFVETLLNDITIQSAKDDIKQNLTKVVFKEGDGDSVRSVIRLPMRSSSADDSCCFTEGIMGVTPLIGDLNKPSVFVRIRLNYFCNSKTSFTEVVHDIRQQKEEITKGVSNVRIG